MIKGLQVFFQTYRSLVVGDIPEYIDKIQRGLCTILIEIAEAHFESASQAARAFSASGRQSEMESAIAHLRDVFNIARKSIYKEKSYSHLFGLISGSKPVYSFSERIAIILYLAMIAKLISRIYLFLGEPRNSDMWLRECEALGPDLERQLTVSEIISRDDPEKEGSFSKGLSSADEVIFLQLFEVDRDYLTREDTFEWSASASGGAHKIPRTRVGISEAGRQFLLYKLVKDQ
jgi:hypothetical protein